MSNKQLASQNKSSKSPDTFDACSQLANAIQLSCKQDQITWAIFGVFWPANALLLVALFTTGDFPKQNVGIVVSIVGFILSVVWTLIQYRALAHLVFFESVIQRIETKYINLPSEVSVSARINKDLFDQASKGTVGVRRIMKAIGVVSAILWLISFIYFICLIPKPIICP
ncbi:MAG: hypothetical protein ABSB78_14175 [Bacteroidota bacterium]